MKKKLNNVIIKSLSKKNLKPVFEVLKLSIVIEYLI